MKERAKYFLVGIMIGILIGIAAFFLLLNLRVLGPFAGREFMRPDNLTNFTRNFTRGMV